MVERMTPRERAALLEREAEHTDDPATWAVAGDAWLEVGDPTRAWYTRVRSREPYGTSVGRLITRAHAEDIAHVLETDRLASGVTNGDRAALELFRFMALQPDRVFAYYATNDDWFSVGDAIRTWMGDYLGTVVHRGQVTRPFGNPHARVQHVRVRAINGYIYSGTCALDSGNYCKLKRGKPWLRSP